MHINIVCAIGLIENIICLTAVSALMLDDIREEGRIKHDKYLFLSM